MVPTDYVSRFWSQQASGLISLTMCSIHILVNRILRHARIVCMWFADVCSWRYGSLLSPCVGLSIKLHWPHGWCHWGCYGLRIRVTRAIEKHSATQKSPCTNAPTKPKSILGTSQSFKVVRDTPLGCWSLEQIPSWSQCIFTFFFRSNPQNESIRVNIHLGWH